MNEEGAGCVCIPGSVTTCYSGPPLTEGIGICIAGILTCLPDGTGYGPCTGEVSKEDYGLLVEEARDFLSGKSRAVRDRLAHDMGEAADLLFHLMVLMGDCGVSLAQVTAELERREGRSGLEEFALRKVREREGGAP